MERDMTSDGFLRHQPAMLGIDEDVLNETLSSSPDKTNPHISIIEIRDIPREGDVLIRGGVAEEQDSPQNRESRHRAYREPFDIQFRILLRQDDALDTRDAAFPRQTLVGTESVTEIALVVADGRESDLRTVAAVDMERYFHLNAIDIPAELIGLFSRNRFSVPRE